jgi:DNA-binding winged helix-turn-helix (wHTH) protein/pimeloyl-ACP methyl ester carboxylesterase
MAQYLFGPFLLDVEERRLLRGGEEIRLRGKLFDTLHVLVQSSGRLIRKDELMQAVWPDTIVEDNNLDHCISQLRKLFATEGAFIETVPRQGYRFKADVKSLPDSAAPETNTEHASSPIPHIPHQQIQFFEADDHARIAYSIAGSGPPLVKAANWLNHLDFEWHSPIWAHWVAELTRHHTLIRYDERGNGLSDWNIQDFSFAAWLRDFERLVDTIKLEKFPVLGISQGGAVAVAYAAKHPERVSQLVLYGAYTRGWALRGSAEETERRNALLTLVRLGWGRHNPAFRQIFTTLFMPEATPEQADWFNELQRVSTSPENAVQLLAEAGRVNVFDKLPLVKCPTLVLHCKDDAAVPAHEGRLIATRIPGARFVELPGRNHVVTPNEPAWPLFLKELEEFLRWDDTSVALPPAQAKSASRRRA